MNDHPRPDDSSSAHAPPPGAPFMNVLRWVLFAGLLVVAVVSIGSYVAFRRAAHPAAGQSATARYYCPMHPTYTSDRPGECPICGMTLEPIPAGGTGAAGSATLGDVPGLTSVHLTPERVQMIGVRTVVVERRPLAGGLELAGIVAPDEGLVRRMQIKVSGWVQQLMVSRVGERIEYGKPVLTLYSPEVLQTEQEYLIESAGDSMPPGEHAPSGSSAMDRLTLLDVPPEEMRRLVTERVAVPVVTLRSRVAGTVLERNVVEGQRVGPEAPLFTVADLSRVSVLADLYEMDLGRVHVGDRATFISDSPGARARSTTIAFIQPTLSAETRTLKVRLTLDNRDGALKPGMFGRVRVAGRGAPGLVVPGEAVVNTGDRQYVFLAHAGGHFEPRLVRTGAREDGMVQVLQGVAEGDTVVASASFLIDSESRLKAAIGGMGGGVK